MGLGGLFFGHNLDRNMGMENGLQPAKSQDNQGFLVFFWCFFGGWMDSSWCRKVILTFTAESRVSNKSRISDDPLITISAKKLTLQHGTCLNSPTLNIQPPTPILPILQMSIQPMVTWVTSSFRTLNSFEDDLWRSLAGFASHVSDEKQRCYAKKCQDNGSGNR